MSSRPPTWMIVLLALQLLLALAGVLLVSSLASAMAQGPVAFAHDDIPLLFPLIAVIVLGGAALLLWRRSRRASVVLSLVPFPVAAALMFWAWG